MKIKIKVIKIKAITMFIVSQLKGKSLDPKVRIKLKVKSDKMNWAMMTCIPKMIELTKMIKKINQIIQIKFKIVIKIIYQIILIMCQIKNQ